MTSYWARRRLKSPASRLFIEPFIQAQIKENSPRHWPLCGEFTGDRGVFPAKMASNEENVSIWWRHHEVMFNPFLLEETKNILGLSIISQHRDGPENRPISHNASDIYPTMHHFVREMCTREHSCCKIVHCGVWAGALWDLWIWLIEISLMEDRCQLICSTLWPPVTWWRKEPKHQQHWYWPNPPRRLRRPWLQEG